MAIAGSSKRSWLVFGALILALLPSLLADQAHAAGNPLDRSFGKNGISLSGEIERGMALALTRDRQGRLIAAGTSRGISFYLRRYGPNGTPDLSFGEERVDALPGSAITDLALEPDGEIIAAGGTERGLALARYHQDGSPVFGFGRSGHLVTPGGSNGAASLAVAIQPNGRILSAGYAHAFNGHWTGLLIGYRPNGEIDPTFGQEGYVEFHAPKPTEVGLSGLELLPDGKILVGGELGGRFLLARMLPDGRPDRSFGGGDGRVLVDVDGDPHCVCSLSKGLALTSSGKPLMLGLTGGNERESSVLARFNPNGSLDRSFGEAGTVRTSRGERLEPRGLTVQPDGRTTVVGYFNYRSTGEPQLAVLRYLPNGKLDR